MAIIVGNKLQATVSHNTPPKSVEKLTVELLERIHMKGEADLFLLASLYPEEVLSGVVGKLKAHGHTYNVNDYIITAGY